MLMRFFVILFLASFFFACTSNTTGTVSVDEETEIQDSLSLADQEFFFNYDILQRQYYWAEEELEDPLTYYYAYVEDEEFGNVQYMYSMLSDSFTYYIPPELLQLFIEMMFGMPTEVGTGLELNDSLFVTRVYKESPADIAQVEVGDLILAVDEIPIKQKGTFERLATGEIGDEINLTLLRDEDTISLSLVLEEFTLPTVFVDSVEGVPVIHVTEFSSETIGGSTYKEWIAALEQTHGAKATIIDLRGNLGGDVEICMDMASELLHKNDTLVIMQATDWNEKEEKQVKGLEPILATTEGIGVERYYVFLADTASASCSEMMLAAVVQNKKSPIVGMQTYGKGIMQYLGLTPAEGLYSVTVAEFLDKNGEAFHRKGFEPDFYSENEDEIFAKALEFIEVEQEREAGFGKEHSLFKKASGKPTKALKPGAYRFIGEWPR